MAPSRLSDRAIILAIGGGIQSLLQTAVGLVLVRLFDSQETFGSYRQVWLILNTLTPFFLLGLTQAIYYYLPGLPDDRHRAFMARCMALLSLSGLVTSIGLFVLARPVAQLFSNPGVATLLRAASFYPLFAIPSMALYHFLVTEGLHVRAVLFNLGFYVAQTALIITLAAVGTPLATLFVAIAALSGVRLIWSTVEIARRAHGAVRGALPVGLRQIFGYSIPVWLSVVGSMLGRHMDKLLISGFLGVTRYAVYSVGAAEFPGIMLVATSSNTVLRPHLARMHHEGAHADICRIWREAFRKQALAILPMAAYLLVFAREFIELLYTVGYGGAAPVFQIYLVLAVLLIAPHEVVLTSIGRTQTVFHGTLLFLGVNLVLSLLLIKPLQMLGPPLGTAVARAVLVAFYSWSVARVLGTPWRRFLPMGILARVGAVAAGAVLVAAPVKLLGLGRFAVLALGGVVFAAAYFLLAWRTRTLTREDMALMREWLTLRPLRGGGG
jgi:O-antigen/teichoic acid export membrane protein